MLFRVATVRPPGILVFSFTRAAAEVKQNLRAERQGRLNHRNAEPFEFDVQRFFRTRG
jgi:superfamily I DNA/RNA helicase